MKSGRKGRLRIPVEFLVSLILVAVIIGGVLFAYKWDADERKEVSGTYSCEFQLNGGAEQDSVTVYYKFDAEKGTSEELWGDQSLMTGKYTVDGNRITVVTDGNEDLGAESETEYFIVDENVLLSESYIYDGKIPEGTTFDAECTLLDSAGVSYKVTFAKDGTYTYETGDTVINGTYERDGKFIHRKREDGGALSDYYIYDGRLVGLVYTKETES